MTIQNILDELTLCHLILIVLNVEQSYQKLPSVLTSVPLPHSIKVNLDLFIFDLESLEKNC